ncbi:MAG TPA: hypothetical protein VMV91_08685 [Rhodocyclaceae bacterium]|nr:hypothetical protein [Rhodocyclaceae bacterium]
MKTFLTLIRASTFELKKWANRSSQFEIFSRWWRMRADSDRGEVLQAGYFARYIAGVAMPVRAVKFIRSLRTHSGPMLGQILP